MSAHRSSAERLATWAERQKVTPSSLVSITPDAIEGASPLCEWTAEELSTATRAEWASVVVEMAQGDADARGQATRYSVRHVRDGRVVGTHPLRCLASSEAQTEARALDGSAQSIITQLQRAIESRDKILAQMLGSTTAAQEGNLRLLGQAYTVMHQQQARIAELETGRPAVAQKSEPDAFEKLMTDVVGPAIKDKLAGAGAINPAALVCETLGLPRGTDLRRVGTMLRAVLEEDDGETVKGPTQ